MDLPETTVYKSMMLAGVPNFAFAIGYTNISWTLKVDLVCEHFCRLLDHMDAHGHGIVDPVLDDPGMERASLARPQLAGYVQRGSPRSPTGGHPRTVDGRMAYEHDVERLRARAGRRRTPCASPPTPARLASPGVARWPASSPSPATASRCAAWHVPATSSDAPVRPAARAS